MLLLIESADVDRPLLKSEAEALVEQMTAAVSDDVEVSVRERRPGIGEVASFAHLWQVAIGLPAALGGGAVASRAIKAILGVIEKHRDRTISLKVGSFELKGPASMFADRKDELLDRINELVAAETQRRVAPPAKRTARKTASKRSK